nr:hypothetical protein CFP56_74672 [Quercus suber]
MRGRRRRGAQVGLFRKIRGSRKATDFPSPAKVYDGRGKTSIAPEDAGDGGSGTGEDFFAVGFGVAGLDDDDAAVEEERDADEQFDDGREKHAEPGAHAHGHRDLAARRKAEQRQERQRRTTDAGSGRPDANGGGGEDQQRLKQVHQQQPKPAALLDPPTDVPEEGRADDECCDGHRDVLLHALREHWAVEGVQSEEQGVA